MSLINKFKSLQNNGSVDDILKEIDADFKAEKRDVFFTKSDGVCKADRYSAIVDQERMKILF